MLQRWMCALTEEQRSARALQWDNVVPEIHKGTAWCADPTGRQHGARAPHGTIFIWGEQLVVFLSPPGDSGWTICVD